MSDVEDLMLSRFLTLYGEPKTDNANAFFDEYENLMRGTRRDILKAAADRVIKAQEFRSWPTPGECVKACHAVAEHMHSMQKASPKPEPKRQPLTPEERERSRALLRQFHQDMAKNNFVSDLGAKAPAADRDTWNSRRVVGVSRYGDPIRKSGPTEGTLTEKSRRMTGEQD
jgi:hypothetical protein